MDYLMSRIEEALSARLDGIQFFQFSRPLVSSSSPHLSNSIQHVWADIGRLSHGSGRVKEIAV
jgi:hypothetical protein